MASSSNVFVNLIAIALVIGAFSVIPAFVGPDLPWLQLVLVRGLAALFVLGWLGMLLRPTPPQGIGRVAWPFSSRFVVWGGIALLSAGLWLWMPHADEALLFVCIACQFCTAALYLLLTIDPPPSRSRVALAPIALPVSIALYLIVHPGRFSVPLVIFDLGYIGAIFALQRAHQGAVDDAFHARRAVESALAQVAAERDARTRFLTSASHDLGQPLQAAQLSFEQAMRNPEPGERERAARRVRWALDATALMLQGMLEHLRLEAGVVAARVSDVAVGPLIARLAELHEPAARLANVDLHALPSGLTVRADPALLERAIGNLLLNAIRHARAQRILVGARRARDRVRIWIIDDGVGIPAADAGTLFDDYVRGSNHGDEIRGGFGLGLASAQRITRLMDGRIGIDVRWTRGSAFWIELPRAPVHAAVAGASPCARVPAAR